MWIPSTRPLLFLLNEGLVRWHHTAQGTGVSKEFRIFSTTGSSRLTESVHCVSLEKGINPEFSLETGACSDGLIYLTAQTVSSAWPLCTWSLHFLIKLTPHMLNMCAEKTSKLWATQAIFLGVFLRGGKVTFCCCFSDGKQRGGTSFAATWRGNWQQKLEWHLQRVTSLLHFNTACCFRVSQTSPQHTIEIFNCDSVFIVT